ncbi:MAG: multi-sensor hybrid histidine kinase [Flavisolibacter sp.]|jgi:GAF domain-containing protein|nr:multi-sensor hybrid histidine kinase [Flavisolibacter sp.]
MTTLQMPGNEAKRIETLKKYQILDTPPDGAFDRITQLASTIFNVPIAIISLVDSDRIWFKSHHGLPVHQIDREPGLCASAILSTDSYTVENAIEDPRTLANPLVAGEFGLRFYAAAPLQTAEAYNLGTLCIIDKKPRVFSQKEKQILKDLAAVVMDEMELRLTLRETVQKIKNISSDISGHIKDTIKNVNTTSEEGSNAKLLSHLEASRLFLMNMENGLDHL